jgi:hypothetical protein
LAPVLLKVEIYPHHILPLSLLVDIKHELLHSGDNQRYFILFYSMNIEGVILISPMLKRCHPHPPRKYIHAGYNRLLVSFFSVDGRRIQVGVGEGRGSTETTLSMGSLKDIHYIRGAQLSEMAASLYLKIRNKEITTVSRR